MRNNKLASYGIFLTLVIGLFVLGSCKKKKAFNEEDAQEAIDAGMFRAEGDAALEDVNNAITSQFLLRGKGVSASEEEGVADKTLCGVLDTAKVTQGILTLRYNSTVCNNRKKEGMIVVTIMDYPLKKWKQKGCVLRVDFQGYKVTGASDGKSMRVDGTVYVTNESGSTWYDMRYLNVSGLSHSLAGNDVKLTFDGSNAMVISVKRLYTYSIAAGVISCTVQGLGTQDGKSNLESWGLNREGQSFTSEVINPIIWKTSCGANSPVQGDVKVVVSGNYFDLNAEYGMDAEGGSYSGNSCPYGWKVSWQYKKKTNKRILTYTR